MRSIIIVMVSVLCFSCGSGHLTRRYKSVESIENDKVIQDNISVGAYFLETAKTPPTPPKTIFDLSPKGQNSLITEISKKEKLSDDLIKKLGSGLSLKSKKSVSVIDRTLIKKQVVISISNRSHMPANRISKINVTLDLGDDIKLLSCNKIATSYETLDLGKLNYSNTTQAALTGDASTGIGSEKTSSDGEKSSSKTRSNGAGLTGTVSASSTFSEEVMLRQRRVALNASISNNTLSLYQDGIVGIDLTGNIIADIVFEINDVNVLPVYTFKGLVDKNNKTAEPKDVIVNEILELLPNIDNSITAAISFEAHFREVTSGDETISESDDIIKLYHGAATNTTNEVLIPKEKINNQALWKLSFSKDQNKFPIEIKSVLGQGDLVFNSSNHARDFAFWLIEKFDDTKKTLEINNKKYTIVMPSGFSTIKDIEILPY
ncbi:hypothetical protein [Aquimarina sp. 2304DJ70-9]|uniref:hypothetical protein n=1 Tax=Aquimarina penaris TaxID=3231044 RepID=UPI0034629225